tara:strand:- start:2626 stop:3033 length:408 start_codon:yes stop_codon:yes gene_type:complete
MAGIKLTKAETDNRVDKCLELRFQTNPPMLQREWIKYCHKHYGDKSEQQYFAYWATAKNRYDEGWRAKLDNMLTPAMDSLLELLASDNEKIRSRAVDQIVKYTGNDIEKIEANINTNVVLNWGDDINGNDPGDEQ